jgi:ABC-type antimicrobial peptide transport system permease subunit
LRNLQRGGIYSAINIGGLAIGMAAAILILAWIYHEWSYDRFHAKEKQLYMAYNRYQSDGMVQCEPSTFPLLGPTLKANYPDVSAMARMYTSEFLYAVDDYQFRIQTAYTDPDFLTMFDFPLLQGDRATAMNEPYSVILTEKTAVRLFGKENPVGKTLTIDNKHLVTVTGVMKDLPGNTMFRFEALSTIPLLQAQGRYNENWNRSNLRTFVELNPKAQITLVDESIRSVARTYSNNQALPEQFLHPLGKQHLYAQFENGVATGGDLLEKMRLYGVIAGLILFIACINFMNLSTARSQKRAKEVGVRKVLGGKRWSLIGLFLGESAMTACIAGAIALILALMVLPVFSTLMGQQITLDLTNGWFWVAGLGFVLLTSLLAGGYPAFYLSSFLPVKVLKGLLMTKRSLVSPRKVLVVLQFSVACALIASTLVIHRQIKFAQNRDSGYNPDQLINTGMSGDVAKNYELIKQDLLNSGTAVSVTRNFSPMTQKRLDTDNVVWQGKDPQLETTFNLYFTDAGWSNTTDNAIIEGRDIDVYTYPTDSTAVLLNESALQIMNLEHPTGQTIKAFDREWHIVGVIKDFIIESPYEPVAPMLIGGPSGWFNTIHMKLSGHNRTSDNLAKAEQIFKQYNPAYPFEYQFVDEEYARKFQAEQKMGSMVTWFAGLTIFISCMGLFALVAYMAETRRKEIGIRKVLGASVSSIIILLSKEFLILVLISIVIASPVAWLMMNKWLANYAYRTDIPWWLFVVVGGISLVIALLTVGFQAIRAATENPVKAIKSE